MKKNRSPGPDGLLLNFQKKKILRLQLGASVVKSLNKGFREGELSSKQKEGVKICIQKGDKAKDQIKNI